MEQPITTFLGEIIRAAEHCKRESQFLGDEDLLVLFGGHLRLKFEEYLAAMKRQETRRAEAPHGARRVA